MKHRNPSVLIIGAGATGMLAYIKLKDAGITDITILEKSDKVGGTWRENTYPGVACDIPAPHYCYSFEPYIWQHHLASGHELQSYMEHVGQKYNVTPNVKFNENVTSSIFNRESAKWQVQTANGTQFSVDFVICATGILHHPKWPNIDGYDQFTGESWHTAQWRHDLDLTGKKIGVIGTGSTAHQAIPALINQGLDVKVFQRTAQWVAPVPNIKFPHWLRRRWERKPSRMRVWKAAYRWLVEEVFVKATVGKPLQKLFMNTLCKAHLWRIRDSKLRAKLTPDYEVGCKRLIINTSFYPAIQKPNAHLITDPIQRIEGKGLRMENGEFHDIDILIYATGFHNFNYMRPMELIGQDGATIEEAWPDGTYPTYKGLMIENFPNFILMLGPGTPIGNNTVIGIAEKQLDYVLSVIDLWRSGKSDMIMPSAEAIIKFTDYIKAGMDKTAWTGGCSSWYLDGNGTPTIFPYDWPEFLNIMSSVDESDFSLTQKSMNK